MKRFISFLLLWATGYFSHSQTIDVAEYFFDEDPGYGSGTSITITSGATIDENFTISTGSLSVGFHTLYIRVQDDGGNWGLPESRLVFVDHSGAGNANNLDGIEYFFDEDPGIGGGDFVSAGTAANMIDVTTAISTASLGVGFHNLYIRARDEGGTYGVAESRLVFVDASGAGTAVNVDAIEYFFDEDPGVGAGTFVSAGTAANMVDISTLINTGSLATGFHTLYIRAQSEGGDWGLTESRLVFVDASGAGTAVNVDGVEYFFDEDPGIGAGTFVSAGTASNLVDISTLVSTASLVTGFHTLYIRAQSVGGDWGLSESRLVFVDASGAGTAINVDAIEYFFDEDPGIGAGTFVSAGTPANFVDILHSINTGSLSVGFHTLYIRAQAEGGDWGLSESRLVFVDASGAGTTINIDAIEYFFDEDPGVGAGTLVAAGTPANVVDILSTINTGSLSTGFHTLYIRARSDGGDFGMAESRLVFVDASGAGTTANITDLEYFFDHDPGIGAGTIVSVGTPANQIDINQLVDGASLSLGFHTLFFRAIDENGTASLAESRLIYVDRSGANVIAQIDQFEYFFDDDPGFGNGTAVPFSAADNIDFDVVLPASSLSDGHHTLTIRPQNVDGTWGLGETYEFASLAPSRELDSLSLKVFYDKTDGANWTTSTNWFTGTLDTWFGVDVVSGRVDSVQLSANNILGEVPRELAYISELKKVDLSYNQLVDTIPDDFTELTLLETFILNNNELNGIPDLSTVTSLQTLALDTNFFDFGDLEPLVSISGLSYQGQTFNEPDRDSLVSIGQMLVLDFTVAGSNNEYQWYQDEVAISGATSSLYSIPDFMLLDTGTYQVDVTNTLVTGLTIESPLMTLYISQFEEDSLAMVSLYNALDGPNWTTNTNWLTGDLDNWFGLTVTDGRLREVSLSNNNLSGIFPSDINLADSIEVINLAVNAIQDTIPTTISELVALQNLNLSDNDILSIPDLNAITTLTDLHVDGNIIHFGDLEINLSVTNFVYSPQQLISAVLDTLVVVETNPTLSIIKTGLNNTYEWFKDGTSISTDEDLTITAVDFVDEGTYRLDISNTIVTGLTLSSGDINLKVSSLQRDTDNLKELYNAAGGTGWTRQDGWSGTLVDATWEGVTLDTEETRVVGLSLPNNNLDGAVPAEFANISQIETVDLSQNLLTSIPTLTSLGQLTSFDVSENALGFKPLEDNAGLGGGILIYDNQSKVATTKSDTRVVLNKDQTFSAVVSGDNNQYQWYLDGNPISGGNQTDLVISNFSLSDLGTYHLDVTNTVITDLTIQSDDLFVDIVSFEQDSIALVSFYNALDGTNWNDNTGWTTGDLDAWTGVTLTGDRVTHLSLPGNNLTGTIPDDIEDASALEQINLSDNNIVNSIPSTMANLSALEILNLSNNDINSIPVLNTISTLTDLLVGGNILEFADIEANLGISNFVYTPQDNVVLDKSDTRVLLNTNQVFSVDVAGANNLYQWFKDGSSIAGADQPSYTISSFTNADLGTYRVDVTNSIATGLTIQSDDITLEIVEFEQDSLTMVTLYNEMDGLNWANSSNWLTGDLDTWFGISVSNARVDQILLSNNQLTGKVPDDISAADAIVEIDFSQNSIQDTIPSSITGLVSLVTLNLSNNEIRSIPDMSGIGPLTDLLVDGNLLQFGDLELNAGISNFVYSSQGLISPAKDTLVELGDNTNLIVFNTGDNNSYEWFKDGSSISTSEVLSITNADFDDEADYRLDITNSVITGLTLSSGDITFRVTSLQRDTDALKALYDAAGGSNWTRQNGWDQATADNSWDGVQLNGDNTRVISLDISNNNAIGVIPDEFLDITQIETVNASQNDLTSIPVLESLIELTSFNVSDNRLQFDVLEANANLAGGILNYASQKNVEIVETGDPDIKVQVHGNQTLSIDVAGENNTYQWSFEGSPIAGATGDSYEIVDIDITTMGDYSVAVNNDVIDDLTISSNDRRVLAVTDVFGTLFRPNGTDPLTAGNITISVIRDGPYDSLTTVDIGTDGAFLFEDIVLGDYNLLSRPDLDQDPDFLQTYLGDGIFWDEADTLFLRDVIDPLTITMQGPPDDPTGDATVFGVVEQDLPEDGRSLLPRRRTTRASISFRRSRGIGRDQDDDFELIAVTETDENGEFRVENLEDGEYLFNVQFPGIPMDPNSFVLFNLGENLDDSELQLAALITEDGIVVEKIEETGIPTPLFRTALAYPNPSRDFVNIRYSLARPISGLQMEVLGVDGVRYMQQSLDHSFGMKDLKLDFGGMAAGMYLIVFQDTDGIYRQQLRITKH